MGKNYNSSRLVNGLTVDANGNVGVGGNPNASYKLAVTGASLFTGAATFGTGTSAYTFGGGSAAAGGLTDKDLTLKAWSPSGGTNEYGGNLILSAGVGTGNTSGKLGSVVINVGTEGATSSTLGTLTTIATFTKNGLGIGTSSPSNILHAYSSLPRVIADTSTRFAVFNLYYQGAEKGALVLDNQNKLITLEANGDNTYETRFVTGGSERMRIRSNGNKTFNGPGGQDQMFSNSARTSNGDYIDINTESGGGNFQGFLIVANTYAYNGAYRTQGTYSVLGRDTTISATGLSVVNGPTGSSTYSITSPSTGVIRITNTGLYGDLIVSWRGFV